MDVINIILHDIRQIAARNWKVSADDPRIDILGFTEVLWPGWDCRTVAGLVRLAAGKPEWVILDDVHGHQSIPDLLRERLDAYQIATAATKRLLVLAGEPISE